MYEFDWTSIPGAIPLLLKGMAITLEVTLTAIVVGIVCALAWSWQTDARRPDSVRTPRGLR